MIPGPPRLDSGRDAQARELARSRTQERTIRGHDFKRWRKSLDLSQKQAAHALGLKRRVVQYYERGERDGKSIEIPLYIRLACYALMQGVEDFEGPLDYEGKAKRKRKAKPNGEHRDRQAKARGKAKTEPAVRPAKRKTKAASPRDEARPARELRKAS